MFRINVSIFCPCSFQCYTPEASLQLKKDWDIQAKAACKDRATRHQPWVSHFWVNTSFLALLEHRIKHSRHWSKTCSCPYRWDRQKMSKVVVVGDLNVGKTCLINRYLINKKLIEMLLRVYNLDLNIKIRYVLLSACSCTCKRVNKLDQRFPTFKAYDLLWTCQTCDPSQVAYFC